MVVEAGHVDIDPVRLRVEPTGQFRSAADIGDLQIRPSLADVLGNLVLTPAEDGATPARSRCRRHPPPLRRGVPTADR